MIVLLNKNLEFAKFMPIKKNNYGGLTLLLAS